MPSDIFTKIFDDSITKFKVNFSQMPKSLFYDSDEKLFHPAEYGRYRESIVRDFFKNIIYEGLCVSEGFLININNQHSTQCDVVIYDKQRTPVLTDSNILFIPVETAVAVGEIKSTLNKSQFKEALVKLAGNKRLKEQASGSVVKRSRNDGDFNACEYHGDQLFSFLICNSLSFDISTVDFDEIYDGVEYRNRHNLILSVEDGLFLYKFGLELMPEARRVVYEKEGVNTNLDYMISYSNFLQVKCPDVIIPFSKEDENCHIREFLSELHSGIHHATILEVDIRQYYRQAGTPLFT